MQHHTTVFRPADGWDRPLPAELDSSSTLVLAFAAPAMGDQRRPFDDLAVLFPQSILVGCSTAGEICGAQVHDASVSVAISRFEHSRLAGAETGIAGPSDSFAAGVRLASQLDPNGLRALFVLSDGLHVNGTPLVAGLTSVLPADVTITGGLAGDGSRFASTWVLGEQGPQAQRICAVGFYGERFHIGHGCDGGWSDFGPERRITRSSGNVLHELDGQPALDLYKTYLGERAQGLPGTALLFPLAVRRADGAAEPLVRTILSIDEEQRSLTFAGDVPQGGVARLMRANTDNLIGSAGAAARRAAEALPATEDALVISVSCVGRRLVLGERTEEEVETVLDSAPRRSAHVGFYSYGEISPPAAGGASELHNQTMTVTMIAED